jgi:hypothetical protein
MRMNFTSLKVTQYMYIQELARTPSKRHTLYPKSVNRFDELQRLTEAAACGW